MFSPKRPTNESATIRFGDVERTGVFLVAGTEGLRISQKFTPHERLYIHARVLIPMADSEDIDERMDDAEEFFEGDDQWYHIDDYVDEDERDEDEEDEREEKEKLREE